MHITESIWDRHSTRKARCIVSSCVPFQHKTLEEVYDLINYRGQHTSPVDQLHYIKKLCEDKLRSVVHQYALLRHWRGCVVVEKTNLSRPTKMTMNWTVTTVRLMKTINMKLSSCTHAWFFLSHRRKNIYWILAKSDLYEKRSLHRNVYATKIHQHSSPKRPSTFTTLLVHSRLPRI